MQHDEYMPSRPVGLQRPESIATEADICHSYRLLLGREPDAGGFDHFRRLLAERSLSARELAREFLSSHEFAASNNKLPIEVPLDGYSLFVQTSDRDIGESVLATHQYEPHVTAVVREVLQPCDVFVDVGANIGYFTILAAHLVGPQGHVVAVEPMDKNLQLIYRSLENNRFEHVRVHPCAASDRVGLVCMATGPRTSNGQVVAGARAEPHTLRSQARLLDELTADLARIDLVKFDIEGYELLAWRGFLRGLEKHRPVVLTEFHPHCMRTHVGIDPFDYLEEMFRYASTVTILARDETRQICETSADVMRCWEIADKAMRADGTDHLDLLIQPRT